MCNIVTLIMFVDVNDVCVTYAIVLPLPFVVPQTSELVSSLLMNGIVLGAVRCSCVVACYYLVELAVV